MRIETERLVLDLHSRDDFADMADMWADPDTVRFIGVEATLRAGGETQPELVIHVLAADLRDLFAFDPRQRTEARN